MLKLRASHVCACLLQASTQIKSLRNGKSVHAHIVKTCFDADTYMFNNLLNMYIRCGCVEDACQVFEKIDHPNLVSWTSMISGLTQHGNGEKALKLYCHMLRSGTMPNQYTFASVLRACACIRSLQQLHGFIIKAEFDLDVFVGSSMLDMYAKLESMEDARQVFDKMPEKNLVSWTSLIAMYVHNRQANDALRVFCQMQAAGMKPDMFTFASVFRACAGMAAMQQAKQVHCQFLKTRLVPDVSVGSALVDMYAKCGSMEDARCVFDKMSQQDTVSWSAMIAGYAQHGMGNEALSLFSQMQQAAVKANHVTFLGVLSACSHVGLLEQGRRYFQSMNKDYGIAPGLEHYACMVDLLGRAGFLDEAEDLINKMPFEPGPVVWRTFLGACRIHGNVELAKQAAEHIFELESQDAGTYVLLSNIYAAAGMWDRADSVRKLMKDRGLRKQPGYSWIEVKSTVHAFVVGDVSEPQMFEI